MGRGKAIGNDYFPDDLIQKEELLKLAMKERDVIFKGPESPTLKRPEVFCYPNQGQKLPNPVIPD